MDRVTESEQELQNERETKRNGDRERAIERDWKRE